MNWQLLRLAVGIGCCLVLRTYPLKSDGRFGPSCLSLMYDKSILCLEVKSDSGVNGCFTSQIQLLNFVGSTNVSNLISIKCTNGIQNAPFARADVVSLFAIPWYTLSQSCTALIHCQRITRFIFCRRASEGVDKTAGERICIPADF